jgi:NAD(P)-dependent dehydrogenase (short-subunit alcohol dehydrogenase family)
MEIAGSTALVTGSNRGLGREIVKGVLERGAEKVYATARDPESINDLVTEYEGRVVPLAIDLTDAGSISAAESAARDVKLLINNASTAAFVMPFDVDPDMIEREMKTNYFGTYSMIRAWTPIIKSNGGGTIVNVLSLCSLASTPSMTGYSASKAAAHSLTQAVRTVLTPCGIRVLGVYPGAIDTEMLEEFDLPKTSPRDVARNLLDGVEMDQEEIFPCPQSTKSGGLYMSDPKAFEREFAALA